MNLIRMIDCVLQRIIDQYQILMAFWYKFNVGMGNLISFKYIYYYLNKYD